MKGSLKGIYSGVKEKAEQKQLEKEKEAMNKAIVGSEITEISTKNALQHAKNHLESIINRMKAAKNTGNFRRWKMLLPLKTNAEQIAAEEAMILEDTGTMRDQLLIGEGLRDIHIEYNAVLGRFEKMVDLLNGSGIRSPKSTKEIQSRAFEAMRTWMNTFKGKNTGYTSLFENIPQDKSDEELYEEFQRFGEPDTNENTGQQAGTSADSVAKANDVHEAQVEEASVSN